MQGQPLYNNRSQRQIPTTMVYVDPNQAKTPQIPIASNTPMKYQQPQTDRTYDNPLILENQRLKDYIGQLQNQNTQLQIQLQSQKTTPDMLQLQQTNQALMNKIQELQTRNPLQNEYQRLLKVNQDLQNEIVRQNAQNSQISQQISQQNFYPKDSLEQKLIMVTDELDRVNRALETSNTMREQLQSQLRDLKQTPITPIASPKMENQLQQKDEAMKAQIKECEMYQQLLTQTTQDYQNCQIENNRLIQQNQAFIQEIENNKRLIMKLKQELSNTENELNQMQQLRHQYQILNQQYADLHGQNELNKQANQQLQQQIQSSGKSEKYIDQLIESLDEMRQKLEIATNSILQYQQKLQDYEFVVNDKSQLDIQYRNLKQNYAILEQDRAKLQEQLKLKQLDLEALRQQVIVITQKQNQQASQININDYKVEIEQWKSKLMRVESVFAEMKKEEQLKNKCLYEQIQQLQTLNNELQQQLKLQQYQDQSNMQAHYNELVNEYQKLHQQLQQQPNNSDSYKVEALQEEVQRLNSQLTQAQIQLSQANHQLADYQYIKNRQ